MLLHYDTFWSYLVEEDEFVFSKVQNLLTKSEYDFVTKNTSVITLFIEELDFLGRKQLKFPSGLVKYIKLNVPFIEVIPIQTKLELKYTINEVLDICNQIKLINSSFEIRDYQAEAVLVSANRFASLIEASTGAGKTNIMGILCRLLKDDKILILNNQNFILQQIYERLISLGISQDEIGTGCTNLDRRIQICSTQTMFNRIQKNIPEVLDYLYNDVNTIITDECQHLQSITGFLPILYTNPNNLRHIVGYSGSPFRNPKYPYNNLMDIVTIGILGEPAFKYSLSEAIEDTNIAQTYSYFINYQPKKCYLPEYASYNSLYSFNIMKNENRNRAGIELIKFLNKHNIKTLVLFSKIDKHGLVVQKQLYDEGIKSLFLCGGETIYEFTGKKKPEKRKGNIDDIKKALNSDYNIILGSSVFYEGIDISTLDVGILFGGGKSPISLTQANGRVARKKQHDLNASIIVDFKDIGGHYIFQNQYEKRRQILRSNGVKNFDKVQDFMDMIIKIEESKNRFQNSKKEEN